jgi:hypothetical protein
MDTMRIIIEHALVFCLLLLLMIDTATLESTKVTTALKALGGDEALDFGTINRPISFGQAEKV